MRILEYEIGDMIMYLTVDDSHPDDGRLIVTEAEDDYAIDIVTGKRLRDNKLVYIPYERVTKIIAKDDNPEYFL